MSFASSSARASRDYEHVLKFCTEIKLASTTRVQFRATRALAFPVYRFWQRYGPQDPYSSAPPALREHARCEAREAQYPDDGIRTSFPSRQERASISERTLTSQYGHTCITSRRLQSPGSIQVAGRGDRHTRLALFVPFRKGAAMPRSYIERKICR